MAVLVRSPALSGGLGFVEGATVEFVLWILAVILVVAGIVMLFRQRWLYGALLIILGLLVGPGGVSIFT